MCFSSMCAPRVCRFLCVSLFCLLFAEVQRLGGSQYDRGFMLVGLWGEG